MSSTAKTVGPFGISRSGLTRDARPVPLGQRALALLVALADAEGAVSKQALMEAGWPGTVVEEGNLTVQIAALRKVLGERDDGGEWIVTVPRVGYRLVRGDVPAAPAPKMGVPTLGVRPFENINTDSETVAFAEGLVEDLHAALNRFRGHRLLARSATSLSIRENGGARPDYVIEGSVRRLGDQLRIAVRLVVSDSGATAWSHSFNGTFSDAFALQDSVSSVAAAQASRAIRQTEWNRSMRERPGSSHVYDLVQRGIGLLEGISEPGNREAIGLLEQAVTLAPDDAQTLAAAAWAYEQRVHAGWVSGVAQEARCLELARAAIAIGGDDANILGHCGIQLQLCGGEWQHGLQTTMRGVEINPNSTTALFFCGVAHLTGGTLEGARDCFERARHYATDDELGNPTAGLAHVLICEREFEEALGFAERALAMRPRFFWVHYAAIAANAQLGRLDAARDALASYRATDPDASLDRVMSGQRAREAGRHANLLDGLARVWSAE